MSVSGSPCASTLRRAAGGVSLAPLPELGAGGEGDGAEAAGGAAAAGVELGAGGEGGVEEPRNAAASVADGGVTLTSPWIDMPGWPRPGHAPTARTAPRTTRAASIVILATTLNKSTTIADHHLSKQSDQDRCISVARMFPRVWFACSMLLVCDRGWLGSMPCV